MKQRFFFRSVGARGMLSAPRRSEEIWKDLGGLGGGAPQKFFYVFINFIKQFCTNLSFQNMNYLLTIVEFHHVNPVMDPGIFGPGWLWQWLWSTTTRPLPRPRARPLFSPTAFGTRGSFGIGEATLYPQRTDVLVPIIWSYSTVIRPVLKKSLCCGV